MICRRHNHDDVSECPECRSIEDHKANVAYFEEQQRQDDYDYEIAVAQCMSDNER